MSEMNLIGTLLVTHGRLGEELLEATRTIVGDVSHMAFLSLGWNDDVEESKHRISNGVQQVNQGRGVIILTDMFGGTPSNLSMPLLEKNQIEIVTGVNLPMLIKLANQSGEESLDDLAKKVRDQGQRHITIASELLGE